MTTTMHAPKDQLVKHAQQQMLTALADNTYSTRQKLALTCRILFDGGHDSGLAGQITARAQVHHRLSRGQPRKTRRVPAAQP